ncbi:MAG TPA: hypothetical protein VGV57_13185 [Thermoleophilaceae bacterium]|nr:hypothetical protein [Thermoleophilaceae bacterium]
MAKLHDHNAEMLAGIVDEAGAALTLDREGSARTLAALRGRWR